MVRIGKLLALFSMLLLAAASLAHAETDAEGWRLSMDSDNVKVWKRAEAGSDFVSFRAETTIHTSLSGLLALFYDLDAAPQWLDHTSRVVALQRDDVKHSYVMLIETEMPWPLKNRDAVIAGHWWQDPASHVIYMRGKATPKGSFPENPAFQRYYDLRNDWTFIPQPNGNVRVIMEGHADPAGNLPAWAVNLLIQQSPFKTLQNMRSVVAQERYQKAHLQDVNVVQEPGVATLAQAAP